MHCLLKHWKHENMMLYHFVMSVHLFLFQSTIIEISLLFLFLIYYFRHIPEHIIFFLSRICDYYNHFYTLRLFFIGSHLLWEICLFRRLSVSCLNNVVIVAYIKSVPWWHWCFYLGRSEVINPKVNVITWLRIDSPIHTYIYIYIYI